MEADSKGILKKIIEAKKNAKLFGLIRRDIQKVNNIVIRVGYDMEEEKVQLLKKYDKKQTERIL